MTEQQKKEIENLIWDLQVACKDYGYGRGIQRGMAGNGGHKSPSNEIVNRSKKDANETLKALFELLGMTENKFEID